MFTKKPKENKLMPEHIKQAFLQSDESTLMTSLAQINCSVATVVGDRKRTPLHFLADLENIDNFKLTRILLANDADPNALDLDRNTPLHLAVKRGHMNVVRVLIAANADPMLQNTSGETALHLAVLYSKLEIIDLLLANASPVVRADRLCAKGANDKKMAIHYAAMQGNPTVIRKLVFYGADINAKQEHNYTALHYAARNGALDIAMELVESGAKLDIKTINGETSIDIAKKNNKTDLTAYFDTVKNIHIPQLTQNNMLSYIRRYTVSQKTPEITEQDIDDVAHREQGIVSMTTEQAEQQIVVSEFFQEQVALQLAHIHKRMDDMAAHSQSNTNEMRNELQQQKQRLDEFECEAKLKTQLLNEFREHKGLILFYNIILVKLESIFIGLKAIHSGLFSDASIKADTKAASSIKLVGHVVHLVPGIGLALKKMFDASAALMKREKRQKAQRKDIKISYLMGSMNEFSAIASNVAMKITQSYRAQILALNQDDNKSVIRRNRRSQNEAAALSDVVKVAEYMVLLMLEAMQNGDVTENDDLEQKLLMSVWGKSLASSSSLSQLLSFKLANESIKAVINAKAVKWAIRDVIYKSAWVAIEPMTRRCLYFHAKDSKPDTYFYKAIPYAYAKQLSLEHSKEIVPVPHVNYQAITQTFVSDSGAYSQENTATLFQPSGMSAAGVAAPSASDYVSRAEFNQTIALLQQRIERLEQQNHAKQSEPSYYPGMKR